MYDIGRNKKYYKIKQPSKLIKEGLMIYSGFLSSIEIREGGVKLLLDTVSRITSIDNVLDQFEKDKKAQGLGSKP